MSTQTVLTKKLNRKYNITQAEIERALTNGIDLCILVADKFNMDPDTVKNICDVYMSLLIIKKNILQEKSIRR